MKFAFHPVLKTVFTALAAGIAILSGIGKLSGQSQVVDMLTKMGVAAYLIPLGLMELGFAGLYWLPATRKIGFLLLTAYFSGALAVELSHHSALVALLPLTMLWMAAFLQDRSLFLPTNPDQSPTRSPSSKGPLLG
jgi:hypothetical protein